MVYSYWLWKTWFNYFSTSANLSACVIGRNDSLFWYAIFEDVLFKCHILRIFFISPCLHRAVHILRILDIMHVSKI